MDNRVGDNIPTPVKLADLQKKLGEVVSELEKFCIVLSKDERKRLLRARKAASPWCSGWPTWPSDTRSRCQASIGAAC